MRFWVLATVCLSAAAEAAQSATGSIAGVVFDQTGAPVPQSLIRIRSLSTGEERELAGGDDGGFVASALPPGDYHVTAAALGFRPAARTALVEVGASTRVRLKLTVDAVAASVTVTDAVPLVRTDHHQSSGVVRREQIEQLPLNGREYLELARLEPGVTPPVRGTNNRTFVSVLGSGLQASPRIGATRATVDGANVALVGGIGAALKLSPDAVREFQIATAGFDVATGPTSSGAINVVTRSGSTTPTGGLLWLYRDHRWSAYPGLRRDPLNPDPEFRRQHESGWFGGPLTRDRVFVFAAAEHLQQSGVVSVQPAAAEFRPLGGIFASRASGQLLTARIDARLGAERRVFARYSLDRSRSFAPQNDRTDLLPSGWTSLRTSAGQAVLGFAGVFRSRLIGELQASQFRLNAPERPASAEECEACFGLGLPRIVLADAALAFGDARTLDYVGHRYQLTGSLASQWRRHTLRLLAEWERGTTRAMIESPQSATITLWSPQRVRQLTPALVMPASFHSVADVLQLPVQSYSIAVAGAVFERGFRPTRVFDQIRIAAGDTWRLGPRATINAGGSWAYDPNALNHDLTKPALLAPVLGAERLNAPRVERDRFAGVAGLAWSLTRDGRSVLHAGAGRYFDAASTANSVNLVMERQALSPAGTRITDPPTPYERPTETRGSSIVAILPAEWARLRQRLTPGNRDLSVRNIDATKTGRGLSHPDFTVPYSIHVNAGVQRELTPTMGARIDVVWRSFYRTFLVDIDMNRWNTEAPLLPRCLPAQRSDLAAVCSNGPIMFDATAGRARYRGLLVRVDKRMARGSQLLSSYAFGSFTGTNGTAPGAGFDLDDWRANDGPLPTDRRHMLTVSGVISLPANVQLSGTAVANSAPPMSVYVGGADFDGDGTRNDLLPGTSVNQFRRTGQKADLARAVAAYNAAWAGQALCCRLGPAPRVTLPAEYAFDDSLVALDLRLARRWRLPRGQVLVFADVFNVFNTANLVPDAASGNLLHAGFGQPAARGSQIFGSGGPRAMQMGARLVF